ncbi:hypothetical protein IEO21_03586 [Rhodonia placenta]|uniref:Uncharacterized protein n=1 Tax=Rhodonia placenta TaxID=104341 RepID=A0A8H7P5J1_9APHY|nr:hypothetical protein IEO21_03586 [Postia placenta]
MRLLVNETSTYDETLSASVRAQDPLAQQAIEIAQLRAKISNYEHTMAQELQTTKNQLHMSQLLVDKLREDLEESRGAVAKLLAENERLKSELLGRDGLASQQLGQQLHDLVAKLQPVADIHAENQQLKSESDSLREEAADAWRDTRRSRQYIHKMQMMDDELCEQRANVADLIMAESEVVLKECMTDLSSELAKYKVLDRFIWHLCPETGYFIAPEHTLSVSVQIQQYVVEKTSSSLEHWALQEKYLGGQMTALRYPVRRVGYMAGFDHLKTSQTL